MTVQDNYTIYGWKDCNLALIQQLALVCDFDHICACSNFVAKDKSNELASRFYCYNSLIHPSTVQALALFCMTCICSTSSNSNQQITNNCLQNYRFTENVSSQRSIGRSSTRRLDTNRFSSFNKSIEEVEKSDRQPKSPTKKTTSTSRLDRSRFAKFEMNNQTNGDAQPKKVTRNFVINKGAKKRFGSDVSTSHSHVLFLCLVYVRGLWER